MSHLWLGLVAGGVLGVDTLRVGIDGPHGRGWLLYQAK